MKRPVVIAAGLLVAALIVAGGVVALWLREPAGLVYTVAQVATGLRQHPRQWAGHTVAVRGMTVVFRFWGRGKGGSQVTVLVDRQSVPTSANRSIPPMIVRLTPGGSIVLNAPGTAPALLLYGAHPARRSPLADAAGWVTRTVAWLRDGERRTNTYSASAPPLPPPPQPRVYRVHLLALAHCPAPLVTPCYTAVVR